mmetsp:Transcript_28741/g.21427  ORF Transcript_28741/g.21427 Transcript_28741/m.21427 type:complete len:84 (-) Transcript_28741:30-281(-)
MRGEFDLYGGGISEFGLEQPLGYQHMGQMPPMGTYNQFQYQAQNYGGMGGSGQFDESGSFYEAKFSPNVAQLMKGLPGASIHN